MQTIVVSGGGTGIGAAVVRRLSEDGHHVTAAGRRREPLDRVAAAGPGAIDVVAADVASPDGATAVAGHVRAAGRQCAGVVAAAGGYSPTATGELDGIRADWQACFENNVLTSVLLVEAVREDLLATGGRAVLISSQAALRGSGGGPYGAMKAALHAWMYDLARDLGAVGGTANVVAPGFVPDTEFWSGRLTERFAAGRVAQTLVGRAGTPSEVAALIAWLLGPDAGWVTGQVISPNGGAVLGR